LTGSLATSKKTTPIPQSATTIEKAEFQADRVIPLAAAHGIHDTYQAFLPPLLPEFIEMLALSNTQAGLLTVFLRAPSLVQPFIGYLADRVSLRYFVILAPAVTALVMSLLGVAPNYLAIVLLLLISGLSSACLHATGPVMVGRVSGRRLGHGMSYWMVGGEGGRVLGPLIITAALGTLGLVGMPWLMIGGLLTSLLLFTLLREVPARPPNAGEALPWRDALREMGPFLALIMGLVITRGFIVEAMSTYLTIFLREQQAERWLANSALAMYQAAGVGGAMISGSLSDRWGRRRTLGIFLLIAPALLLGFLTVESWLRFPLLLGLGFTTISLTPVLMALMQESYPQNRALANGIYMAFSFALRSGVTVVIGALGDAFGLTTAFIISALVAWSGLWFVSRLNR
jgi:MFS transporter, FSR family, fosmidomycin resistance protein